MPLCTIRIKVQKVITYETENRFRSTNMILLLIQYVDIDSNDTTLLFYKSPTAINGT